MDLRLDLISGISSYDKARRPANLRAGAFFERPNFLSALCRDVGLPEMTLHGPRHMHASLLLASGAYIALVSKRLGHSSISITSDIYTHIISGAARQRQIRRTATRMLRS